ncbi:MAG: hypothetical protein NTZ93_00650 [Candidatus Beckwithbacteria bacterium]|nr:hypothetical protein [Candidatus Beckwithbacteria bacterium]
MITVIHGDNTVQSRQFLNDSAKDFVRLEAADLTPESLTQILESSSLFGSDRGVVINHLPKDNFLTILSKNIKQNVFIWEKKSLSAVTCKKLIQLGFVLKEFRLPKIVFQFLNSLTLKDFHATIKTEPVELVFYLLHRRIAQLIQRNPDTKWLKLHRRLLEIDWSIKSGQTDLSLTAQLDLLLAGL